MTEKKDNDVKNQKKAIKQIKTTTLKAIAFLWATTATNAIAATYRSAISWVQSSVFPTVQA
jgi:hypothetical protein